MKRKTQQIIKGIEANTQEFPAYFYHDYWHLPLPVAYDFITSNRTPKKIKRPSPFRLEKHSKRMGFICFTKYANNRF
ncbi:DUF3916 domain-containing protein [Bacillus sp. 28A-2]|uniref:DUF3916 domain-containing protein n=1 Tax=Bacillus sp. 28A-2 TaxID=2772252 RepID=UPI001CD05698